MAAYVSARDPDFAPQLDEEDSISRVLAEGDAPLAGDLGVLQEAFDHLAPELRLLRFERASQGGQVLPAAVACSPRCTGRALPSVTELTAISRNVLSPRPHRTKVSIGGVLLPGVLLWRLFTERFAIARRSSGRVQMPLRRLWLGESSEMYFMWSTVQSEWAASVGWRRQEGDVRQLLCRFVTEGFS